MNLLTLGGLFLAPNAERERWIKAQTAWRGLAAQLDIILDDDDRDDTWPVMKRTLGMTEGLTLSIGVDYLELTDASPLDGLTCEVGGSGSLPETKLPLFVSDDPAFDERFTVRASEAVMARELLGEGLRAALGHLEQPLLLRYERGHVRISVTSFEPGHLANVIDIAVATCKPTDRLPYR